MVVSTTEGFLDATLFAFGLGWPTLAARGLVLLVSLCSGVAALPFKRVCAVVLESVPTEAVLGTRCFVFGGAFVGTFFGDTRTGVP